MNEKEKENQVSKDIGFMEEIESFKDTLDQEYERRVAEIDKKREAILSQIQEMYAKKIESFNEELKEEEKRALLQAEELEKRYRIMAEDLVKEINKSKLIESILHDISGDLWPNLGSATKQKT
jgi:response regulator RpfG family c-di-GMP phosphodiesterase